MFPGFFDTCRCGYAQHVVFVLFCSVLFFSFLLCYNLFRWLVSNDVSRELLASYSAVRSARAYVEIGSNIINDENYILRQ